LTRLKISSLNRLHNRSTEAGAAAKISGQISSGQEVHEARNILNRMVGVATDEQVQADIAMLLSSTASLRGDVPAGAIFDFSLAAVAAK